jgi:hypothetical protein
MATAHLINPEEIDGCTWYAVDTWPMDAKPFTGPDERNWDAFRLDGDGASYEWRTGADHVRRAAQKVARGDWTHARAMKDPFVRCWVEGNRLDDFAEVFSEYDASVSELSGAALVKRMLLEVGPHLENTTGLYGYYGEDDDAFLEDALYSLDLPEWASIETFDDGGPGSGFQNAALVLAAGKTLDDLAAWLAGRAAPRPARGTRVRRHGEG